MFRTTIGPQAGSNIVCELAKRVNVFYDYRLGTFLRRWAKHWAMSELKVVRRFLKDIDAHLVY
jgi:hypothetical protein